MKSNSREKRKRIGFISTRLAGEDGVSLETDKWARILEEEGFECYYMAGELDTPKERSFLVPEAHFRHPEIAAIRVECFQETARKPETTDRIRTLTSTLKSGVREFVNEFDIDLIVVENALAIPMNIPLGIALTEYISETRIPTIAHHHDFFWERKRFLSNAVWDYLNMSFPPHLPSIHHVVINSSALNQLALRTGIAATLCPNVMDFDNPPQRPDEYASDVREAFGIGKDELFILQPTRVVKRKGIEHAIELVRRIGKKAKLVISHASGDEGPDYEKRVRDYSDLMEVDTVFESEIVDEARGKTKDGRKIYTIADVYPHADLVTYPSDFEGFGNAFLEAIYFRKPIVVNSYSIYAIDIRPKGFDVIEMDGYVSAETVKRTLEVLENPEIQEQMADENYELGRKYYSYSVLRHKLRALVTDCFGANAAK